MAVNKDLVVDMLKYGLTPTEVANATGATSAADIAAIQSISDTGELPTTSASTTTSSGGGSTSTPSTSSTASSGGSSSSGGSTATDYTKLVNDAYTNYLGRAADQGGVDYWVDQLKSGAVSEADFQEQFVGAALYNAELNGAGSTESAAKIIETAQTIPALQNTINVDAINSATKLRAETGQFASQTTGANQLANIYQLETGRDIGAEGLDFYNGRLNQLYNAGWPQDEALAQVQAEISNSQEGATYDTNTPADQNKGINGSMGTAEQFLLDKDIAGYDTGNPETWDQLQARQDQLAQQGIDPITGQQTGAPATDYYGTVAQTGGLIGSGPTSAQLTPFQQASLAQNQALLGTMEASAGPFGRLATTDYNRYMNPYTTGVIDTTMQDLERQRLMQQNQIGAQATAAGAYGGSRHGVAEALTNEAMQRTMANTAAQQRQAGFQQAQSAAQQDIANEMAQRQFGLGAAQQMSGLGQTSYNYGTGINNMLAQAGAQQQALQQAQIDAAKGQYAGYTGYPAAGTGIMNSLIGSSPYGTTTTSQRNIGPMDVLTAVLAM